MPQTVSHYRLEEEIGRGGMGIVYRATDLRLDRTVALKMLPPGVTGDADRQARFVREARAASALNHPNIVTIHDIDRDGEVTFIAMELVDGTPLDRLLAGSGPLPLARALEYGSQVAAALGAAHAQGIVHRDVKPANIVITPDGRAKVLDFGLAKLVERSQTDATQTAFGTRDGTIVGTAAYMSPEQAEGRPVDARSDVFSLGAVLYEMLSGRRPFDGTSSLGIMTAILRDQPPPIRTLRTDAPPELAAILDRALAKDPAARYPDAEALRRALAPAQARASQPAPRWRRPAVLVPAVLVLATLAGVVVWRVIDGWHTKIAREELLPAIEQALQNNRPLEAVQLAREAERYVPEAVASVRRGWVPFTTETTPSGAQVSARDYLAPDAPWVPLGSTPVTGVPLPIGLYRLRFEKPGYAPVDVGRGPINVPQVSLTPAAEAPDGMVLVTGGPYSIGLTPTVELPDFWIDRHEVTNRAFKRFVDAGGYREPKYWVEPLRDGSRILTFDEAMARFRDSTGRNGPAGWELGTYPAGQEDFPVSGISWFEAAAYAEFAGRSLPSLHQWYRASGADGLFSHILRVSNFESTAPVRAGALEGVGPFGTTDMAGNVKEWSRNEAAGSNRRYVLGGAWNEPSYRFVEPDAQDPWARAATFGVRLVKNTAALPEAALAPVTRVHGDPESVVPEAPVIVGAYRRFYEYDRTPLHARVERVDTSTPEWRRETVSFNAAYGNERVTAHLLLPAGAKAPYQTIVLFPSAYAVMTPSSERLDYRFFDFIVRSGRAVLYPVYKGTYERRVPPPSGPGGLRDLYVQRAKDFFRSMDYLETRADIDPERLGYYSLSMGAYFGPVVLAQEPRLKVAVLAAGGLRYSSPPEIQPANFAPLVKIPVLLINGRDDFDTPPAAQRRFLELFGTPPAHKRLAVLEGGHVPTDIRGLLRETLDWLDKHLGPVR